MSAPKSEELEELIDQLNCLDLTDQDAQILDRMMVLLDSPELAEEWGNDPAIPAMLENLSRPHDPDEPRCLCREFSQAEKAEFRKSRAEKRLIDSKLHAEPPAC